REKSGETAGQPPTGRASAERDTGEIGRQQQQRARPHADFQANGVLVDAGHDPRPEEGDVPDHDAQHGDDPDEVPVGLPGRRARHASPGREDRRTTVLSCRGGEWFPAGALCASGHTFRPEELAPRRSDEFFVRVRSDLVTATKPGGPQCPRSPATPLAPSAAYWPTPCWPG